MRTALILILSLCAVQAAALADSPARAMRFNAVTKEQARRWQKTAREKLYALMMGGKQPERVPLDPRILRIVEMPSGGYTLYELSLQTLPDRRAHAWMAVPRERRGRVGAVLALHGHGGVGEEIVRGQSLYWYGRALAERGYVVISPDIGSHDLQHDNWTLMGERTWDALRCVDYLLTRPEVDPKRLAVCGLSLGGETTMYAAALDERLKAVDSAGWLTTIANMKNGHCPCWDSPGLEESFDFADIFACIAPRPLVCEVGAQERAPGGFPVEIARQAFEEVRAAYRVFGAEDRVTLDAHPYGHVFVGREFWNPLRDALGTAFPWAGTAATERRSGVRVSARSGARVQDGTLMMPGEIFRAAKTTADEPYRRGEIARRAFCRALGVLDGWWAHRDPETSLLPRQLTEPVWAPSDNAADLLPFLYLTARFLAPERLPDLDRVFENERKLTNRVGVLPDWYSLKEKTWVHPQPDTRRLLFCAAEYSKDGLLPMTEMLGRGPWTDRMLELLDAVFENAPVKSDFGLLPADDTEVNGELLQVLARVYAMTRDEKHWEHAARIADAYCREVLPGGNGLPAHRWDFAAHKPISDVFSLNDHGNEIVGGLAEFLAVTRFLHPDRAAAYEKPLRAMGRRLLAKARNDDGLWVGLLTSSTAEVRSAATPDTWGYALSGVATIGMVTDEPEFQEAARRALKNIDRPAYYDWSGADSYADSIEGGLLLLNRYPTAEGFRWLETVLPVFLGRQRDDGVVEGWYGDGNYARTALMAAFYYTQGTTAHPWRADLRFGAVRDGNTLTVGLTAPQAWEGALRFDTPRHRDILRLPLNYPRLNEFPEWYTIDPAATYRVRMGGRAQTLSAAELAQGIPVKLRAGQRLTVEVERLPETKR